METEIFSLVSQGSGAYVMVRAVQPKHRAVHAWFLKLPAHFSHLFRVLTTVTLRESCSGRWSQREAYMSVPTEMLWCGTSNCCVWLSG